MSDLKIEYSKRMLDIMSPAAIDKKFNELGTVAAEYFAGRHSENKLRGHRAPAGARDLAVPLAKGFGPWKGRGNKRTTAYPEYAATYKKRKTGKNWLVESGQLYQQAVKKAEVKGNGKGFEVAMSDGPASKYASYHQYGSPGGMIPQRKFYDIDESDMKKMRVFIQKQLLRLFGGEALVR